MFNRWVRAYELGERRERAGTLFPLKLGFGLELGEREPEPPISSVEVFPELCIELVGLGDVEQELERVADVFGDRLLRATTVDPAAPVGLGAPFAV